MDNDNGFSPTYPIELLARNPIAVDEAALTAALAKRLGRVTPADGEGVGKTLHYALENYPVGSKDRSAPARLVFLKPGDKASPQVRTAAVEAALEQSSQADVARSVYRACEHSLLMANMLSSSLPQHVRREIVVNSLLAILEVADIDLVYWMPTQQMIMPDDIREQYSTPEALANPVFGFLNVRLFRITNSDGDIVMDTLGLNALGLTDFQVHFHQLDTGPVGQLLYGLGAYAFEKGDVIEHGHTVGQDRWRCQHEMALVPPVRELLDINPGPGFAAGNRT